VFYDESVTAAHSAVFTAWRHWRDKCVYPAAGGYLNQPLALLVQIEAIDLVYQTWAQKTAKDFDWSKFTATQREIIKVLENDETPA
jgi:hypothetical protein